MQIPDIISNADDISENEINKLTMHFKSIKALRWALKLKEVLSRIGDSGGAYLKILAASGGNYFEVELIDESTGYHGEKFSKSNIALYSLQSTLEDFADDDVINYMANKSSDLPSRINNQNIDNFISGLVGEKYYSKYQQDLLDKETKSGLKTKTKKPKSI